MAMMGLLSRVSQRTLGGTIPARRIASAIRRAGMVPRTGHGRHGRPAILRMVGERRLRPVPACSPPPSGAKLGGGRGDFHTDLACRINPTPALPYPGEGVQGL